MDIEFEIASSRYSVTPILADSPYSCSTYSPLGTVDIEKKFLHHVLGGMSKATSSLLPLQNIPRKSSYETKNIRDEFAEYFTAVVLPVQWIPKFFFHEILKVEQR
ncbi:hypothetical protein Avbf_17282 [Armadillidium vulgare]|nr:hypothetical protein Avbf_17282 [Armadillidium vulgare]